MPDISKLVIEVDANGVVKANGELVKFSETSKKAGKSTDDLANKMGALQLIANKLPGPLKSVAAGLMGIVSPATAAISAFMELGEAAVRHVQESVDAFAKFEMIKTNLEIVSSSAAEASRTFNDLQKFAVTTPFKIEQLAETATMLRQAGISANELIPTLKMLGDAARGSSDNFGRIALNFAQVAQTSKATAMDMRQFMLAGVPIQKMLENIGKAGSTSYEDIAEAIKVASKEGGQFADAMEKGSKTITGMVKIIENLKEQNKALWAEFYNTTALNSFFNEYVYNVEFAKNTILNAEIEIGKINKRIKDGTADALDEYRKAEIILKAADVLHQTGNAGLGGNLERIAYHYKSQSKEMTEIYNRLKPLAEAQENLNQEQAEYNALLEKSESGYRNLQAKIEEYYAKTTEGQREAIENEIKWWRAEQQRTRYVDIMGFDYESKTVKALGKKQVGIEQEEYDRIEKIINMIIESRDKAKEVKHEFADWVELLAQATGYSRENVELWQGLGTVEKYAAEVEKIQGILLSQDGDLIKALGLENIDVLESSADKVRSVLEAMLNSGKWDGTEKSVQYLIEALKQLDETVSDSHFTKFIDEWKKEIDLLGKSSEEIARHNIRELLKSNGVLNATDQQVDDVLNATFERDEKQLELRREMIGIAKEELRIRELTAKFGNRERAETYRKIERHIEADENYSQDKEALEYKMQIIWLSEKRLRIEELTDKYLSNARAREIYALEQQIEKTLALKEAIQSLAQAGLQITASGLATFAHDLGAAFRDGTISSDELSGAVKNMLRAMIDAMPQLLLNVGLQLIMAKRWALGLAFIGASGLMSFVSGMIEDSNDSGRNDEAERLRRIQEQITDLIDQQRRQAEYYFVKKRSVNATAVNDAIITPKGIVYTHPEDYIIATKTPETLMSGGGGGTNVDFTPSSKQS